MKKILTFILLFSFLISSCASDSAQAASELSAQYIENKGSDTIVNLALAWAEKYQSEHPDVRISVTGGGSGTGIAALVNDTSTATNLFPLFASATTGTAATLNTSDAKLLYKPSTGEFQSSALVASNGIVVNAQTVTASYTLAATNNAMSTGPITIDSGVTVTISSGARYVVI